jgi:hypothetical protein
MRKAMMRVLNTAFVIGLLAAIPGAQGGARKPIEGIWKVTEIVVTGADASNVPNPQPSLVIFTPRHYSLMYVTGSQPRKPYTGEDPTDAEKMAAFDSFVANSGTYEVAGGTLTLHPIVARNPGFMAGGFDKYQFRIEGTTLSLINKSTDFNFRKGDRVGPSTAPLSETRLKLVRVE